MNCVWNLIKYILYEYCLKFSITFIVMVKRHLHSRNIYLPNSILTFYFGVTIGFILGVFYILITEEINPIPQTRISISEVHSNEESFQKDNISIALRLADSVSLLCWVVTSPLGQVSSKSVRDTWGRKCTVLLFENASNDTQLQGVALNTSEVLIHQKFETKETFYYIYNNFLNKTDWFFISDDHAYVVTENLRFLLSAYDPSKPIYFGYLKDPAHYVLSRETVRRTVENCKAGVNVTIETCFHSEGVLKGDLQDKTGHGIFFEFNIFKTLSPPSSDIAALFYPVSAVYMYILEYFIYHLQPYGISHPMCSKGTVHYSSQNRT